MFDLELSPLYLLGSIGLGVLVPSICGMFTLFYKFPEQLVLLGFWYQMFKCGMKEKYVRSGDKVFCYGEKNSPKPDQPTIVFVHGFTASKFQWLAAFRCLRLDCHLIAVDLPGHGNSSVPGDDETIDLNFLDSNVCLFLDLVGLGDKKVHLVGASLGGAMVGIFAALHPDKIAKVSMICPAMNSPVTNQFVRDLKETMKKDPMEITHNDCILLPQNAQALKEMFQKCIYNKKFTELHPQIYQGALNLRLKKNNYFLKLFRSTNTQEYLDMLVCVAPSIRMPSQIIWGKHDQIIDSSGAELLQQRLPDCRYVDILENCGHAVDVDRPGACCKALEKFILDD